ncbi:MAG: PAS domain S-box protein [Deltaproteobacteria bacterium]|nr:PAS domain S-box protein [Deltaproteobacteria bacterium]
MSGKIRFYQADKFVLIGIILALLYWFVEAVIHEFVFEDGSLVDGLIPTDMNELWMRLFISLNFLGFSLYARTIVARRRDAEELLREERDMAQMYLDAAGVIFLILDAGQKVTLINRRGCEVLGYEEEEIVGRDWFENFLPERIRRETTEVFESLFKGGASIVEYHENTVVTKSGAERLVAWHNVALRDRNGKASAVLSSGEDITEKRLAEDTLRERFDELERFRKATVERELRMQELKERVFELERRMSEMAAPASQADGR